MKADKICKTHGQILYYQMFYEHFFENFEATKHLEVFV